jgi:hypothetical protein
MEAKIVRMKSTHILGTLELVGEISDLKVKDKWLIMNLRTTTPTGWNLKAALSYADLLTLLKLLCRPRNLVCLLFGFIKRGDKKHIPEY